MTHKTTAQLKRLRAQALEAAADMSDGGSVSASGNPPDVISSTTKQPVCSVDRCDQSVIPGSTLCGVHGTSYPDGGGPNSGPDGSWSDGTNASNDVNGGFQDGTLRQLNSGAASKGHAWRASTTDDKGVRVEGMPIVYNRWYKVHDRFGSFQERMALGVVSQIVSTCDCRFLFNHDGLPLARSTNGTLTFRDTPSGLTIAAYLNPDTQVGRDVGAAIARGDMTQMSCGFIVAEDQWNEEMTVRTIKRIAELLDVSAVTYPASPTTSIAVTQTSARLRAQRHEHLARRDALMRRRDLLISGDHMPIKKNKKPNQTELDKRAQDEAGRARRAALKKAGVDSYRSLRAKLNGGRDVAEVR